MAGDSESTSPKTANAAAPGSDAAADTKTQPEIVAKTEQPASDVAKPLAPPPRPSETDYFALKNPSLNLEPNPFDKSFSGNGDPVLGGGAAETPGGTKLPPVSSITSPSSLLPGSGTTPFNWGGGGSLRAGPLSPAMLSGPQTDYFGEYGRGFPTPNESSLRTGLTPGGSGSMFPGGMPSPNTQAMFNLAVGGATPGSDDFHRTALRASQLQREQHQNQQSMPSTSQPQGTNGATQVKTEKSGPYDSQHDNEAANGLFMLAQGRGNGAQQQSQYPLPPQPAGAHGHPAPPVQHPETQYNGNATRTSNRRGVSEAASEQSEDSQNRPNTRGRGKRASGTGAATTNGRRKAEEPPAKAPSSKKAKHSSIGAPSSNGSDMEDEDDGMDDNDGKPKHKMTDEEKRKNFLERNRVAALKCRQRKKQWLANLQNKVDIYQTENDNLSQEVARLREEVVNLKTLLLAHKDCTVTQASNMNQQAPYMGGPMDQYPQHLSQNYQMGQMNNFNSMIPAGVNRRPS